MQVQAPQKLQAEAFAQYDGKAPAVKKINYLSAGRGETRALLAESGQAEIVFTHDAASFDRLKKMPSLQFYSLPIPRTIYIKVNSALPKFNDVRVRQALSMAIDRDGIASAILREPKAAATQLFTPGMTEWHLDNLQALGKNVIRAKELLKSAGWEIGRAHV